MFDFIHTYKYTTRTKSEIPDWSAGYIHWASELPDCLFACSVRPTVNRQHTGRGENLTNCFRLVSYSLFLFLYPSVIFSLVIRNGFLTGESAGLPYSSPVYDWSIAAQEGRVFDRKSSFYYYFQPVRTDKNGKANHRPETISFPFRIERHTTSQRLQWHFLIVENIYLYIPHTYRLW